MNTAQHTSTERLPPRKSEISRKIEEQLMLLHDLCDAVRDSQVKIKVKRVRK